MRAPVRLSETEGGGGGERREGVVVVSRAFVVAFCNRFGLGPREREVVV
jgi:hypothetical protein